MIASARVVVTNAPTRLDTTLNPPYTGRGALLVNNPATNTVSVEIGGATVAAGAGYTLAPGDPPLVLQLNPGEDVYAISNGANVTVQVLQGGLV